MSQRLKQRIPDNAYRKDLLRTVHYEATRAGLDPQMVLGKVVLKNMQCHQQARVVLCKLCPFGRAVLAQVTIIYFFCALIYAMAAQF